MNFEIKAIKTGTWNQKSYTLSYLTQSWRWKKKIFIFQKEDEICQGMLEDERFWKTAVSTTGRNGSLMWRAWIPRGGLLYTSSASGLWAGAGRQARGSVRARAGNHAGNGKQQNTAASFKAKQPALPTNQNTVLPLLPDCYGIIGMKVAIQILILPLLWNI